MFDVVPLITALGIEPLMQDRDEVIARCPHHSDTGKPNWSINITTGQHHCWSCNYGGSLLGLIADRQQLRWPNGDPDLMAARVWARRFRGNDLTAVQELRKPQQRKAKKERPGVREPDLALFVDPPDWALSARRLTPHAAALHGVRWDGKADAWVTPIRDPWTHYLMGWQLKGQRDRLFRNYPVGIEKSRTLFGLRAFDQLTCRSATLVESPLDVVRLESIGIRGALATFGAAVSDAQIEVLASYASEIVIAMDNPCRDKAGRAATLQLLRKLSRRMRTHVLNYEHTDAKDVGDMSADDIRTAMAHAYPGWRGRRAVL